MNKFKCSNCGFTLEIEATMPPEKCPACEATCSLVDNNCYTPDCDHGDNQ